MGSKLYVGGLPSWRPIFKLTTLLAAHGRSMPPRDYG